MAFFKPYLVLCYILTFLSLNCGPSHVLAKVYMVVMEDDPVISYKASRNHVMRGEEAQKYKEVATTKHDIFLDSFLPLGSYKKLYSYTHLLNGFALHAESEETVRILSGAKGVRLIQEDIKMAKMTMYTPNFIGASGVWPLLGGAENSGDGVVIGMIDTGIDPKNPSFVRNSMSSQEKPPPASFKGICSTGNKFPPDSCNGKIVGAMWFARAGQASGEFNATIHYASPYDPDGHGSHTASIAAGNFHTPLVSRGYNFGHASGMAPGARLAIYKAAYPFGGYMSDVIAAVDQAVEDGVNVISLSMGPSSVSSGPASFLNMLETQLLLATKAGVSVIQAVGNGGPDENSVVSFSPWILSVAASTTDRKYRKSIIIGNGQVFSCGALSPPTPGKTMYPLAWADDVSIENSTDGSADCQDPKVFIEHLVQGKVIICMFVSSNYFEGDSLAGIVDTIQKIGAAGVIVTDRYSGDVDIEYEPAFPTTIPSAIVLNGADMRALLRYYNNNTVRDEDGKIVSFGATVRILEGRRATYTGEAPVVADYSSRGPDVENAQMQPAEVLKPNVMAPGHHIWGAWSPTSHAMPEIQGENYALLSGTSMATPHVAGVAALIKQRHPTWSPAMIMSAIMTTADVTDRSGRPLMARRDAGVVEPATPFDMGAGAINAASALDPGLVFDAGYRDYLQFLCAVPGVDEAAVLRAVGAPCPSPPPRVGSRWCSDLNAPSVTVASLVGSRRVDRRVTSVGAENETYMAYVRAPDGVAVRVSPNEFAIAPGATRALRIVLSTTAPGNAFSFGEVVLKSDKKHSVRIPLAVYPAAALGP
ncbi:subtilisin-like protease SBT2.5 [Phragmites australis]|uniref:subtilisin-like protease SBT2.5 n=1 Tax=Phragmites australis TaxID=29695 RepID=UPI002D79771C|nr:subtilisin-like protease SBT2.5 [Phragmites australis]